MNSQASESFWHRLLLLSRTVIAVCQAWLWPLATAAALVSGVMFERMVRHAESGVWTSEAPFLTGWWLTSFPSFIQVVFAVSLWRWLCPLSATRGIWVVGLVTLAVECGQSSPMVAGAVFDWADIAAIIVAMIMMKGLMKLVAVLANADMADNNGSRRPGSTPWRLPAMVAVSFGIAAQLACMEEEEPCQEDNKQCSTAIYLSKATLRADIQPEYGNTAVLQLPGKLYQIDGHLAVVDRYRGLHIFNLSDTQNPIREVYLPIHGITDLTVKGDYLYVNSFTDMVSINLEDLQQKTFGSHSVIRELNVFRWVAPAAFYDGAYLPYDDKYEARRTVDGNFTDRIFIGYRDPNGDDYLFGHFDGNGIQEGRP